MGKHVSSRRRVAGGLTCITVGATALAWGLAGPAFAHGKKEPEKPPLTEDKSCLELAEHYDVDQEWDEFAISDLPEDDTEATHVIDDRGTEDESDDAAVTIEITEDGSILEWTSTIGIDAVFVKGTNMEKGSYFYLYARSADDEEMMDDFHLGVPPWGEPEKNKIAGVAFCYDEDKPDDTTTTTEKDTTTTSETTTSTVPPTSDTSRETEPTVPPSSEVPTSEVTAPPTTQVSGELPQTGSTTMPLVAAGAGLLAVGVALVAGRRFLQQREA